MQPAWIVRLSAATFFRVIFSLSYAQPSTTQESPPTLKLGDPAPPLQVAKWIKGVPLERFETGRVYVVEFWSTWCGPCIAAFPHLSELQREYKEKGVTIIGCTDEDRTNKLDRVEAMVRDKSEKMAFTVAWDKGSDTTTAYLHAAGVKYIPTAFVVDQKGTLAWFGDPRELDHVLNEVLNGKWDYVTGPKRLAEFEERLYEVDYRGDEGAPRNIVTEWEKLERDFPILARGALRRKFLTLLWAGENERALAAGKACVERAVRLDNAFELNIVAWELVRPDVTWARDLELAFRAADHANRITRHADAELLDTLARVHFLKGDLDSALEIQTRAASLAKGDTKAVIEARRAEYERAKAASKKP